MAKIEMKPGNMLYPLPAGIVSVRSGGKDNLITIAWTGTVCSDPPMLYISVRPNRFSYEMLKESKEFVFNLTTRELAKATDFCGVKSGRDTDKWKETGLSKEKAAEVSALLIKESPVNIECRVKEIIPLGSHDMFLAEVLHVHAEEKYFDEKGGFDLRKADLLAYCHGEYTALGEKLGGFGFSVKKK